MKTAIAIYTIWYRDMLRFWRNKTRMLGSIMFPLVFLAVFGSGLSRSMGMLAPGVDFAKFMFPGIIGMTVVMSGFMSGISMVWDREFGFLKEVLVAPISRVAVAGGKTLAGATIATVQSIIIMALAPLVGVTLTPLVVIELLGLTFLVALMVSSMGILISSRIKSMEAFQVVMQMVTFPMMFLSGVFFPVNNVPDWLAVLVRLNPASYAIDPIRQTVLQTVQLPPGVPGLSSLGLTVFGHTMTVWEDVGVVAVLAAVLIAAAMWSFSIQD
ncbi:MAG: ABC transporter permease [Dehalococcoidia bacterium]|nr:ABC transporter permease [Dehalococcoidia bacterium]